MASFMQWTRKLPLESNDRAVWNIVGKLRLIMVTGSQLDFILHIEDWFKRNYKKQPAVTEVFSISVKADNFWESVFQSPVVANRHRVIFAYDGDALTDKDVGKLEAFKARLDLKYCHVFFREFVEGKVNTTHAKYRPFIGTANTKFINCQSLDKTDTIELIKLEMDLPETLAIYFAEYCGGCRAVLKSIKHMKLAGVVPSNRLHIDKLAIREYGDVLADLLLRRKYKDAYALIGEGKLNINLFIGAMAFRLMELGRVIYMYQKKAWNKRDLSERAQVPAWKISELLELSKGLTLNKIKYYGDLLAKFETISHEDGALDWLVSNWR